MSMPLLATKYHIPAFSNNLVRRPHLIKQLNEGAQHRLTLISAPAGFGKTTLAAEWISGYSKPAVWLSLDAGDIVAIAIRWKKTCDYSEVVVSH